MWLRSSTQPISTMRSPAGSVPVGSVSRTISRSIRSCALCLWSAPQDAAGPIRERPQDIADLALGRSMAVRGVHNKVRARPLLRIGHLLGQDGGEFLFAHAGPRQNPLAL